MFGEDVSGNVFVVKMCCFVCLFGDFVLRVFLAWVLVWLFACLTVFFDLSVCGLLVCLFACLFVSMLFHCLFICLSVFGVLLCCVVASVLFCLLACSCVRLRVCLFVYSCSCVFALCVLCSAHLIVCSFGCLLFLLVC